MILDFWYFERMPKSRIKNQESRMDWEFIMKLFVDTGSVKEIEQLASIGILDGVTTNPSLLAKEGGDYRQTLKQICQIVKGPVSAEVVTCPARVIEQAFKHPLTDIGLAKFVADWEKAQATLRA